MISIVISEKGGAERREVFDQDEITVGRVKGNDVLLPKGNVSKQHARVIVRDGRYIVSDLKSTNGTYVNHRRITHATLVREGDRIYIGDFILRIESGILDGTTPHEAPSSLPRQPSSADDASSSALDPMTASGTHRHSSASPAARTGSFSPVHPSSAGAPGEVVSHFPLEHDPDADDAAMPFDVPAPPRMPQGMAPVPLPPLATGAPQGGNETAILGSATSPSSASGAFPAVSLSSSSELSSGTGGAASEATPSARTSQIAVEDAKRSVLREIVVDLIRHVEGEVPAEALDQLPRPGDDVRKRVDDEIARAADTLSLPPEFDLAPAELAAKRELIGLGPLELLLDDENISRIRVGQRDVHVQRRGQPSPYDGIGFATEHGVIRAIRRLAADAGKPVGDGEAVIERELSDGRKLSALLPPAALDGAVLQIRRTRSEPVTLNALVRGGTVSRSMALLLSHGMAARANVLVVAAPDHGAEDLVGALCMSAPREHYMLTIGEDDFAGRAVRLASRIEDGKLTELVRAASRMAPDHLLCRPLGGEPLAALLDAIAEGQAGVVLANPSATLRQAIERMATEVASGRALGIATARDWVCNAFDLAVEVSRLKDGRLRVIRIAELKGTGPRDVFTFTYHRTAAGGAIEGSFAASGVIPRLVEDLAARGMPLDTAIFRRHPTG